MHVLEDLSYMLEDLLEPIIKKDDITPTELDNVYKAVKTMNYIETIKAMKEYGNSNDGYSMNMSNRGSYNSYNNSYGNNSYGRYGRDGDGDGRYSERYNGNYSRHNEKEQMVHKLEKMMDSAKSDMERQTIMECIRNIDR